MITVETPVPCGTPLDLIFEFVIYHFLSFHLSDAFISYRKEKEKGGN